MKIVANSKITDICFCINWFDDISIIRCLESLPKGSHKLVIDGKYRDFESDNELSNDILRKEVLSYDNVTLLDAPNLIELEKRNVYLKHCKQRFAFNIDSDEYIEYVDWNLFLKGITPLKTDLRNIWIRHHSKQGTYDIMPRLISNPNEWELYGAHWIFRRKDTGYIHRVLEDKVWLDVNIMVLGHNHKYRTKQWTESRNNYSKILVKQEDSATKKYASEIRN